MTVTPYIVCAGAADAIEFYKAAFAAVEDFRMIDPSGDGRLGHAELTIAGGRLMLADEYPDFGAISPDTLGGTPVSLHIQVEDVDAVAEAAERAGATILRPPADQSFGERNCLVQDPFGHRWFIAQVTEELTGAEMQKRWDDEVG